MSPTPRLRPSACLARLACLACLAGLAALTACSTDKDPLMTTTAGVPDTSGDPSGDPGGDPSGDPGGATSEPTSAGTDTSGSGHGDCDQYLACVAIVSPDQSAQAEMAYGPKSQCWSTSSDVETACLNACESALMSLAMLFPGEPQCGGTPSTSDTDPAPTSTSGPTETSGPSDDGGASFTSDPQTSDPQTSEPDPSDSFTSEPGGDYGNCGWDAGSGWYGCTGVPGEVDPRGLAPIACLPDVEAGGACSEQDGPVNGIGCCSTNGENFYCARGSIIVESCG